MIISVKENWEAMTANIVAGITHSDVSAIREFDVVFDNNDDPAVRPFMALASHYIPSPYDEHPYNAFIYVKSKSVKPGGGPCRFIVTVNYESIGNPLDNEPEYEWSFANSNEPIDHTLDAEDNKTPITNSAGETFDPPVTKDIEDLVFRITRNEETFREDIAEYINAVNDDEFFGYQPGIVKCTQVTGRPAKAAAMDYWIITYEFQFRRDGWKLKVLDEGFREKTGDDGGSPAKPTYAVMVDDNDKPLSQPVLLDGAGVKLADDGDPVFLEFELYRKKTFADLALA